MTKDAQLKANISLEKIYAEGQTNLWGGIQQGLDVLRAGYVSGGRHSSLILLTDGEPNIFPPSGFVQQLQKYKTKYPTFLFSLNTFAFGKRTDSKLLAELATVGHGDYSFIPCPGFMGTIYVNTISNILSTLGVNANIAIQTQNKAKVLFENQYVDQCSLRCGDIKYGQTRDFVLEVDNVNDKLPFLDV